MKKAEEIFDKNQPFTLHAATQDGKWATDEMQALRAKNR